MFKNFLKKSTSTYSKLSQFKFADIIKALGNAKNGVEKKVFLSINNEKKSFWHDLNTKCDNEIFNMVIEIPYGIKLKTSVSINEEFNPIVPDLIKDYQGKLYCREWAVYPIFNYGFLPRTFQSRDIKYNGYNGDNDALDVCEISQNHVHDFKIGDIVKVRVLGSFCLIDQGEYDWKIIAVRKESRIKKEEADAKIKEIMEWFRTYKVFEGKKENSFLENNKIFSYSETLNIIEKHSEEYLSCKGKNFKI